MEENSGSSGSEGGGVEVKAGVDSLSSNEVFWPHITTNIVSSSDIPKDRIGFDNGCAIISDPGRNLSKLVNLEVLLSLMLSSSKVDGLLFELNTCDLAEGEDSS